MFHAAGGKGESSPAAHSFSLKHPPRGNPAAEPGWLWNCSKSNDISVSFLFLVGCHAFFKAALIRLPSNLAISFVVPALSGAAWPENGF
jgi:hypothetical protein